ncbi:MAG: hypothetical protein JXM70_19655 [Pirellulales bacterium]|nr:hypothetical protein [Pirellulales bacterium]
MAELITREPLVDGIVMETPEHDGHYCRCEKCKADPYPGIKLLNEFVAEIRKHRPDMPIIFLSKNPPPLRPPRKK